MPWDQHHVEDDVRHCGASADPDLGHRRSAKLEAKIEVKCLHASHKCRKRQPRDELNSRRLEGTPKKDVSDVRRKNSKSSSCWRRQGEQQRSVCGELFGYDFGPTFL